MKNWFINQIAISLGMILFKPRFFYKETRTYQLPRYRVFTTDQFIAWSDQQESNNPITK